MFTANVLIISQNIPSVKSGGNEMTIVTTEQICRRKRMTDGTVERAPILI